MFVCYVDWVTLCRVGLCKEFQPCSVNSLSIAVMMKGPDCANQLSSVAWSSLGVVDDLKLAHLDLTAACCSTGLEQAGANPCAYDVIETSYCIPPPSSLQVEGCLPIFVGPTASREQSVMVVTSDTGALRVKNRNLEAGC